MTYDDLLKHFGSEVEIQRALELEHRQTVNKWKGMKRIPTDHQIKAEVVTGGKLKADLPPEIRKRRREEARA